MTLRSALTLIAAFSLFAAHAASQPRIFELRIYHAAPGKLGELLARFRDHTTKIFERHGMSNVGYWTPTEEPLKGKTLYYVISHESRAAAKRNWDAFRDDAEWKKVKAESEAGGKLVERVESIFMEATDFSPLK